MSFTLASARIFPPSESEGWTAHFIERESRYWIAAQVGQKTKELFEQIVAKVWDWASPAQFIRWFTDGERRYSKELWKVASVYLQADETTPAFGRRKVWRQGLEVAIKIKGSQGRRRVEWLKTEHPLTAVSPVNQVHANHNEAQNAAIRRRTSAYRRRQNLYAKRVEGLQRAIDVQRLLHNWIRPHYSLGKAVTPAMAMGYCDRPLTTQEILTLPGFYAIPP
jgi:hypothetical protein